MNAPIRISTPAKPASLAESILAGDLTGLPEHYSDDEWRREAQAALDCEDDGPLLAMVEEGRLHDAHREWQSYGALKGIDRQDIDVEHGPYGRAPLSSFADSYGGDHPLSPVREPIGMTGRGL